MITKIILLTSLSLAGISSFAEQTSSEKASATVNDVKRAAKKKVHRAEEAVCAEGDAPCLAKKAKHRAEEGSDFAKDKAQELKDKAE